MGEYATYNGQHIKIGTCENMYYLRADQASQVKAERGNVDPRAAADQQIIRFRFPWPDEDLVPPGEFDRYDRSATLHGVVVPATLEHFTVQFVAQAGYNVCLPCPEGPAGGHGLTIHRNGFAGPVRLVQQAYRSGVLAAICECGGCGARYNIPTLTDAEPVIVACRAEADSRTARGESGAWWHTVADRIEAGYTGRVGVCVP